MTALLPHFLFFFFNDPAPTEIYTLPLPAALPIFLKANTAGLQEQYRAGGLAVFVIATSEDRKSTRLNSSHQIISYAVFCLKKKKKRNPMAGTTMKTPLILSQSGLDRARE